MAVFLATILVMPVAVASAQVTRSAARVPTPVVIGPVTASASPGDPSRDYPFFASTLDLKKFGYVEQEFFLQGMANRYNTPPEQTASIIDEGHSYKTRLIIRRPASAGRFNGKVVVEWLNVTNGHDQEQTWYELDRHLLSAGYAWVGVSAQRVGVNHLRTWNPARYGTLDVGRRDESGAETITDDALSYDILSQAAQALRRPGRISPLGGLKPEVIIATGHSQSASRLSTYANSIQPLSRSFDAFALEGSLGNRIRGDLTVPVWKILSEYDVEALEGRVRRPDEGLFRSWEVAGTSHNTRRALDARVPLQRRDIGTAQEDSLDCTEPIGTTVPFHQVMAAGLERLVRWVTHGTPMPSAPPLVFASGPPGQLARDRYGMALGGVRLSQVEVPIATSNGTNSGPGTCDRWGFTVPFDEARLAALYPRHGGYVARVANAANQNRRDGFILPRDAARTISEAARSSIGRN